jgi:hypothetical protein
MLFYVLWWWPSWISDRHKKHKLCREPSNDHSWAVWAETTNLVKAKLYMNVHWMVLYKLYVFCSDMEFKMAATAGLSLTLDPMGKMFQNNIHVQFGFNHICSFWEEGIWTFSHRVQCYYMSCSGGHLGFPIGMKNINFVEDLQIVRFLFRYGIQNGGYGRT